MTFGAPVSPCREIDEPIPNDERLYRAISHEQFNGRRVMHTAIDRGGTSFNRHKHCDGNPESVFRPDKPHRNGVAVTTPGQVPSKLYISAGAAVWLFFVADVPAEGKAHCEIRTRRYDATDLRSHAKVKNDQVWDQMRSDLVDRLAVVIVPTPVD